MATQIIDEDWLKQVNDEIDEQILMAIDGVVSDIEYHAQKAVDDQLDACIDNIRSETSLDFSRNDAVKQQIRDEITNTISRRHDICGN